MKTVLSVCTRIRTRSFSVRIVLIVPKRLRIRSFLHEKTYWLCANDHLEDHSLRKNLFNCLQMVRYKVFLCETDRIDCVQEISYRIILCEEPSVCVPKLKYKIILFENRIDCVQAVTYQIILCEKPSYCVQKDTYNNILCEKPY